MLQHLCRGWRTTLGVHSLLPPSVIWSGDQIWSGHETCAQGPFSTGFWGIKLGSPSLCGKHFVNRYTALKRSCIFGCGCWNTRTWFHRGSCRLYLRRKGLGVGPWLDLLNSRWEQVNKLGKGVQGYRMGGKAPLSIGPSWLTQAWNTDFSFCTFNLSTFGGLLHRHEWLITSLPCKIIMHFWSGILQVGHEFNHYFSTAGRRLLVFIIQV